MYTETEEMKKTHIYEAIVEATDESSEIEVSITVDHCDNNQSFEFHGFDVLTGDWITLDAVNKLRKLLNKAVAVHKTGFKQR